MKERIVLNQLSDYDKELLWLDQQDRKRKRKRYAVVIVILTLMTILIINYTHPPHKDRTPPVFELSSEFIEIDRGAPIQYKNFIKTIHDETDGSNISLSFNEIDTSELGEFNVKYTATDKSGNKISRNLKVVVKEKESKKEVNKKEEPIEKKDDIHADENQTESDTEISPFQPSQDISPPQSNVDTPVNKDFLFTDGYNMETVTNACSAYITGYTGSCIPIRDESGIYLGMSAIFN